MLLSISRPLLESYFQILHAYKSSKFCSDYLYEKLYCDDKNYLNVLKYDMLWFHILWQ